MVPDKTPHSAESDLLIHCLPKFTFCKIRYYWVEMFEVYSLNVGDIEYMDLA